MSEKCETKRLEMVSKAIKNLTTIIPFAEIRHKILKYKNTLKYLFLN